MIPVQCTYDCDLNLHLEATIISCQQLLLYLDHESPAYIFVFVIGTVRFLKKTLVVNFASKIVSNLLSISLEIEIISGLTFVFG